MRLNIIFNHKSMSSSGSLFKTMYPKSMMSKNRSNMSLDPFFKEDEQEPEPTPSLIPTTSPEPAPKPAPVPEPAPAPAPEPEPEPAPKKLPAKKKPWYKRFWWAILIGALIIAAVIGVLIWFFLFKKKEGFVPYNNSDEQHKKINLTPETSYLESYIASSLGMQQRGE